MTTTPEPQATSAAEGLLQSLAEHFLGNNDGYLQACKEIHSQLTAIKAENERLREALRFYAECNHINDYCFDGEGYSSQLNERGEVAQKALAVSDSLKKHD